MTIEYTWSIYNLTVVPHMDIEGTHFSDVVSQIWWILNAKEGSYVTDTNGVTDIPKPSLPFNEFEKLTREQVIEWVKQAIGEQGVSQNKEMLARRIEEMKNPPIVHKFPVSWSSHNPIPEQPEEPSPEQPEEPSPEQPEEPSPETHPEEPTSN